MSGFKKFILLAGVVIIPLIAFSSIASADNTPAIEKTHSQQYPLWMFKGKSAMRICKAIHGKSFHPKTDSCYVYANCTDDVISFHEQYWANEYAISAKKVYADLYVNASGYAQQGFLWYGSTDNQQHYDIGPSLALIVKNIDKTKTPSVVSFSTDQQSVVCPSPA
jgi:hypothetical protein